MVSSYQLLPIFLCAFLVSSQAVELTGDGPPLFTTLDLFDYRADNLLNALDPFVPVPYPITNWCYAWLNKFAKISSEFIACGVRNARPFRFCRNCLQQYINAHNFIMDLLAQDDKMGDDSRRCFPRLVDSDIINIVGRVRDFMEHVWDDSACDHCFDHYHFDNGTIDAELTNSTKAYLHQYNVTDTCISAFIKYENGTKKFDQFACVQCSNEYVKLNEIYAKMKKNGSRCMDVTDAMNYTRYLWSNDFRCNISDPNEAIVFVTCAAIFTLPIFFYLISRFQGTVRTKKLMKMKRLNLVKRLSNSRLLYSDRLNRRTGSIGQDNPGSNTATTSTAGAPRI